MPTNVTAEYAAAEMEYQKAITVTDKLKGLERMLREVPKHKGTEVLRMEIKTKISKLKEKAIREKEQKKGGFSLAVKKEGAAQVVIVGPANTGKSSLLNALTKAKSSVSHYPFTTTKPEIGAMPYQTVQIQMVDFPPLLEDASIKQTPLFGIIRNSDFILIVVDKIEQIKPLLKEFADSNIILNRKKPAIKIIREATGGLEIIGEKLIEADLDAVKRVLRNHGIANASVEVFSEVKLEDFFEVLDEKLAYLPAVIAWNKQESGKVIKKGVWETVPVSATSGYNLELLKNKIWEHLGLIKIYTKEPGKRPILKNPITLPEGSTIKDMAEHVHKDFIKKFKYARVWGKSAKHDSASVGIDHKLKDNDIVEIHLK
ncbi:MAG: GTPase [archaeon]